MAQPLQFKGFFSFFFSPSEKKFTFGEEGGGRWLSSQWPQVAVGGTGSSGRFWLLAWRQGQPWALGAQPAQAYRKLPHHPTMDLCGGERVGVHLLCA